MNKSKLFSILFIAFSYSLWSFQIPFLKPTESEIVQKAIYDLPNQGILKQAPDGYVYLKVPNNYVYRLFPLVKEKRFIIPSSIQRHTKIGAHISVIYKKEASKIGPIKELGKSYSFLPKKIKHVRTGSKEYIILEVESPELETLRRRYGLSSRLMNHPFHITLAEKRL